ncbi:MAG: BTAD domain-containing putative transcriptional regulator, partial [Oscillospiraceae bacterium]
MEDLHVHMFGEFAITLGDKTINDSDNRSRKIWLLLAYMIYFRNRIITQEELIDLLWSDDEGSSNPANALKTMFHRVRTMLNQLGEDVGHQLIVRRQGDYAWNPDVDFTFDVDVFEAACREAKAESDAALRLAAQLNALSVYAGDFLPKLAAEPRIVSINAYFHNLYVQTVHEVLPPLEQQLRLGEASELCRRAIVVEPYEESFYYHLMRQLLD